MNNVEIIKELCRKRGVSIARLERELNIGNGAIAKSSSNYMRSDRLKQIADYFGVSMEYLMTGVEPVPAAGPSFSPEEIEYIERIRRLDERGLEMLNAVLDTALWQAEGKKSESRKA